MAEVLEFNLGEMTIDELCAFEEHADQSAMELFTPDAPTMSAKSLASLVWLLKRKQEPEFTIAQARAMKLDDFEIKRT